MAWSKWDGEGVNRVGTDGQMDQEAYNYHQRLARNAEVKYEPPKGASSEATITSNYDGYTTIWINSRLAYEGWEPAEHQVLLEVIKSLGLPIRIKTNHDTTP